MRRRGDRHVNGLGLSALDRGEVDTAEVYLRRALAIEERAEPDPAGHAATLDNLGAVACHRADYDAAVQHLLRAVAIQARLAPGGPAMASFQNSLGKALHGRRDLDAARACFERARSIWQQATTDEVGLACVLNNLGRVALARGDLDAAEGYFERALVRFESVAPGALHTAACLRHLGDLARARGSLDAAIELNRRALSIRERLAPDSLLVAASLDTLAATALSQGDVAEARALASRAVAVVERQRTLVVGNDARALLTESVGRMHSTPIAADLAAGAVPAAFAALERSRARSLVDSLLERHLDFAADAPPELRERQDQLGQQLAAAHRELARLDPREDATRIDLLDEEVTRLGAQQRELESEIRRSSPKYASLRYPQPLDPAGVQTALDPGTLLLAYHLNQDASHLFAVTREALSVVALPLGEQDLREKIRTYRRQCAQPRLSPTTLGRELYDALLRPAQNRIDAAERLLVCADGPLHTVPFSALVTSVRGEPVHYLVEDKALHSVVSATVYQQLRLDARPASAAPTLLAFGDPSLAEIAQVATTRSYQRSSLEALQQLRLARQEVERLGALFGERANVLLGPEASESALKSSPIEADVLHFACHGLFFEEHPVDSALVLAAGGGEDGLLQAWEIIQDVRLNADLVVLSACQTALGREQKFEGLVGLTRAFQYAGARSVIATQ